MIRPAPGLKLVQQPERALFRMNAWCEAVGEPAKGVLGVMYVVGTRAMKKDVSLRDIILAPKQFSWTLDESFIRRALKADVIDPTGWAKVDAIAELWETKATHDVTLGADHYYNFHTAKPPWGRGHPEWDETVEIGNHVFGNCP